MDYRHRKGSQDDRKGISSLVTVALTARSSIARRQLPSLLGSCCHVVIGFGTVRLSRCCPESWVRAVVGAGRRLRGRGGTGRGWRGCTCRRSAGRPTAGGRGAGRPAGIPADAVDDRDHELPGQAHIGHLLDLADGVGEFAAGGVEPLGGDDGSSRRGRSSRAEPVVVMPENGSSTMSCGRDEAAMHRCGRSTGYIAKWLAFDGRTGTRHTSPGLEPFSSRIASRSTSTTGCG